MSGNPNGFASPTTSERAPVIKRIISWIRGPSVNPDDGEDPYTCIKCGETFDKNVSACSACGNQFIARNREE
jgi:DNA-directed RNA polymerase subunit RPC12/RpoP